MLEIESTKVVLTSIIVARLLADVNGMKRSMLMNRKSAEIYRTAMPDLRCVDPTIQPQEHVQCCNNNTMLKRII